MQCDNDSVKKPEPPCSPLAKYGRLDTCRNIMRAYELYRYNLLKARYEQYGRQ
ncbi:MAG: hypothetical protein K2M47_07245 [Clostridiales bacterium]|nr:hypothetical protein [Clostridiales bacterium]